MSDRVVKEPGGVQVLQLVNGALMSECTVVDVRSLTLSCPLLKLFDSPC